MRASSTFALCTGPRPRSRGRIRPTAEVEEAGLDLEEMGVLAYDNLVLNELDIVGPEEEMVLSGGPSPDPTIGR